MQKGFVEIYGVFELKSATIAMSSIMDLGMMVAETAWVDTKTPVAGQAAQTVTKLGDG